MKRSFLNKIYIAASVMALALPSCDNGLEELNVNPDAYNEIVPEYMFTKAQLDAMSNNYVGSAALTIGGSMQHFATYKEVPAAGDKYLNDTYSQAYFGTAYTLAINEISEVIRTVSESPEDVNLLSIARIWKVYIFHRLTDLYGDVPYSQAVQGATDQNFTPVYDQQSAIYPDLLNELEEAVAAFDPGQPSYGSSDLIYGGNLDQWRRFAYSMMMRLGLRLTKVDPALAQNWVTKAIEGGVILDDNDLAYIEYVSSGQVANRNPIAQGLLTGDYIDPQNVDNVEGGKLAKTFIDYLKATGDPRLNAIAVVWVLNESTGVYVADTTAALQEGMPNAAYNSRPSEFNTFSEPNPTTILRYDAPLLVLTPAEMYLSLAEAALRGWYNGDVQQLYENGARAGIRQWALFGNDGVIAEERINAYIQNNPFPAGMENQMNLINTQKWVSLFLDEYEIWANWRRTGYPDLQPTNYPGNLTGGQIPRRFRLPNSEETINTANFLEAQERQGGVSANGFNGRVWWDMQ